MFDEFVLLMRDEVYTLRLPKLSNHFRNYFRDSGCTDPEFGECGMEQETKPERRAENGVKVEGGRSASGDREADGKTDDGTDGGYRKADGERANHPFTMKGKIASAHVRVGLGQGKKKIEAKDSRRGGLGNATDGRHREAHDQRGDSDDASGDEVDASGNAMPLRVVGTEAAVELQRAECDEKNRRKNVNQSKARVAGEDIVRGAELGECGIGWRSWRMIAMNYDRDQVKRTARDDSDADEAEKDRCRPDELTNAPHIGATRGDRDFFRGKNA